MWQRASAAQRWALVVALGALVIVAIDVWWVATYRYEYPLDIDEAGYTTIGLIDHLGLVNNGLSGWWEAFQAQAPNAPLVPALTSVLLEVKPGAFEGFGVLIGFLVLLALATYGIAERLSNPRLGALAALVVASSPAAITFTREFIFALPAAALLSCSVYALIRSEGLRRRGWSVAVGVALGLMLLTRTMTVVFVPGVLLAALLAFMIRGRSARLRGLLNLGLLIAAGALVAAPWYARNLSAVIDYLTGFGYGSQSSQYGEEHALVSWEHWSQVAKTMMKTDLLVPLAAMVFLGLLVVLGRAIGRLWGATGKRDALATLVRSDATSVAIVLGAGYAGLSSSQNIGDGFTVPLTVLAIPLAVVALKPLKSAVVPIAALLALIGVTNLAVTSNLSDTLAKARGVYVPAFGQMPWVSGVPNAVSGVRQQMPGPPARFTGPDKGWPKTDTALADIIVRHSSPSGEPPVVAFASRSWILNTNTVQLASVLKYRRTLPLTQLVADYGDTVAEYKQQLSSPDLGLPSMLVTMSSNAHDFEPHVTQSYAETAARQLDFRLTQTLSLPNGRVLRVWRKQGS